MTLRGLPTFFYDCVQKGTPKPRRKSHPYIPPFLLLVAKMTFFTGSQLSIENNTTWTRTKRPKHLVERTRARTGQFCLSMGPDHWGLDHNKKGRSSSTYNQPRFCTALYRFVFITDLNTRTIDTYFCCLLQLDWINVRGVKPEAEQDHHRINAYDLLMDLVRKHFARANVNVATQ